MVCRQFILVIPIVRTIHQILLLGLKKRIFDLHLENYIGWKTEQCKVGSMEFHFVILTKEIVTKIVIDKLRYHKL